MVTSKGEIIINNFRGINVKDNAFTIDDAECQIGTNIVVTDGAVQVRGGLDSFSTDANLTGGVPMMVPYYKRDGTKQLVFANRDKYYFITADDQTWEYIGDYGTAVDNPFGYQYKDLIIFGTGFIGNTSYKYDGVGATYTAATIAFSDDNPDTITDTANGLGAFRVGDVITVTGSVSNNKNFTVAVAGNGSLTLIASDEVTNEALGANITITSTGMSKITTPANTLCDLSFYAQFLGKDIRLLIGAGMTSDDEDKNSTSLFYTPDPDDWAAAGSGVLQVGPSDGTDITGIVQKDNLVTYKETSKHYLDSFYEENSGAFALRLFGSDNSSGAPNHQILEVVDGDVVGLTQKGKSIEGYGLEGTAQGNSKPKQYGTYINPILDQLNWQRTFIKKTRAKFFARKVFMSVPFQASQFNNLFLVGDWDTPTKNGQPSWTTWGKSIGSMVIFKDNNGIDQFYLGDANLPVIYKYNPNKYSDDGSGYTRRWKSKKFSLGRQTDYDKARHVIIEGFMTLGTEFYLKIDVDGKTQTYKINQNQLINSTGGGAYIGDHYVGDEIIGGESVASNKFRYQAVCSIPNSMRYCKNIEIEVFNSDPGKYWSMDYLSINEQINLSNLPDSSKSVQAV